VLGFVLTGMVDRIVKRKDFIQTIVTKYEEKRGGVIVEEEYL